MAPILQVISDVVTVVRPTAFAHHLRFATINITIIIIMPTASKARRRAGSWGQDIEDSKEEVLIFLNQFDCNFVFLLCLQIHFKSKSRALNEIPR